MLHSVLESAKYQMLLESTLTGFDWKQLEPQEPQFAFIPRNIELEEQYLQGFSVQAFMPVNSVGIVTARDALTIDTDKNILWQRAQDFAQLEPEEARQKYKLGKDVQDWQVGSAQEDVRNNLEQDKLAPIAYRPFDTRWTLYTGTSRGFHCRPRGAVMQHMLQKNLALATARSNKTPTVDHFFVVNSLMEAKETLNKPQAIGRSW